MRARIRPGVWLILLALSAACGRPEPQPSWLGAAERLAPGVELYHATDPTLVEPPAPVSAFLLRLDPERVRLESALANGVVLGSEAVDAIAARRGALAAVNGGYFNIENGEPIGPLKVAGELVSDTNVVRGAVIVRSPSDGPVDLTFDQITVRMSMSFDADGRRWSVPIDGVDTTRVRGRLMLYTPAYYGDTDTAPNGTEWALSGDPLTVVEVRSDVGHTPIPRDGVALSYGGLSLPEALAALRPGVEVELSTTWKAAHGSSDDHFAEADHVIGGAGLLRRDGRVIEEWTAEGLTPAFSHVRHPRTVVGLDRRGFVWLVAVDGRRPDYSVGMTFLDLQRLADRLELTDALNLDGGGSTTMVAGGRVVNRPSEIGGPRAVSDAILVSQRDRD